MWLQVVLVCVRGHVLSRRYVMGPAFAGRERYQGEWCELDRICLMALPVFGESAGCEGWGMALILCQALRAE